MIIALALLAAGCAHRTHTAANESAHLADVNTAPADYEPAAASALAFDAPLAAAVPSDVLDRDARQPVAILGYQETVVESFTIGFEDHQAFYNWDGSMYDRWSYTEKSGVRYR